MLNHPDLKVETPDVVVEQQKLKQKIHMDSFQILEQDEQDSQNQAYGVNAGSTSQVDELFREAPIKDGMFDYQAFTRILKHGAKEKDEAWRNQAFFVNDFDTDLKTYNYYRC